MSESAATAEGEELQGRGRRGLGRPRDGATPL